MSRAPDWPHVVAAAYSAGADCWNENGVTVQRVTGGYNNALYRVEADGMCYACKLCIPDERRRAAREYDAMRLLDAAGLDIAPEPLGLDESSRILPFPAVFYRWLPGAPLDPPLTAGQLAAFLSSYQRLHSLQPGELDLDLRDAWLHWFDFEPYLTDLDALLNDYGTWLARADPEGPTLRRRLGRLIEQCRETVMAADVNPSRDAVRLRVCRADHNLANVVWDADGQARMVDWEYSGWGDPALDLSELRWHAALAGLSTTQHHWLRDSYKRPAGDVDFDKRLAIWDRIITTRWCFLILRWLWSLDNGPDRTRLTQPTADPAQLRARLVYFIERAERIADCV